jgi:SAM-dependent methyltransferase
MFIGKSKSPTSWQNVSSWYNKEVDKDGSYFHQHVILPKLLPLLNLNSKSSVLDLGCGQGILERKISQNIYYQGLDAAADLIKFAQNNKISEKHHFQISDITKPFPISKFDFTHSAIILALQNIEFPDKTVSLINKHLVKNGKLIIIINHPCFRILKNSSWGIDKQNNIQYRRIDRYLSTLKNSVAIHPGLKQNSPLTITYHHSLSYLTQILQNGGFVIEKIEEWISDKVSVGKNADMENLARKEFPLFMAIVTKKC